MQLLQVFSPMPWRFESCLNTIASKYIAVLGVVICDFGIWCREGFAPLGQMAMALLSQYLPQTTPPFLQASGFGFEKTFGARLH